MKSWMTLVILGVATTGLAADRPFRMSPLLGKAALGQPAPTPIPDGRMVAPATPVVLGTAAPLYTNVRYKDQRNIAPCAVPTIVQVPDPCNDCGCVNVQICVPPCEAACIKVSKCGKKVKYDYGDYRVEITSARGRVTVDYDD